MSEPDAAEFAFETLTVDDRGQVVARRVAVARRFVEDLGAGVRLEMVPVPGGSFIMGSPEGQGYPDEQPQHRVTIGPFWLGRYPVTQEQWRVVMPTPAACRCPGARHPVENVSWHDAAEFCRRLAERSGRAYSLPGEAQWEYACRAAAGAEAGPGAPFCYGDTLTGDLADYVAEVAYRAEPPGVYHHCTTEVGRFPPNAFGLCDMHGNVWEWCADAWHDDYRGAPADGSAWLAGDERYRVARGGSWHDGPALCRSASRLRLRAAEGDDFFGFRVMWAENP